MKKPGRRFAINICNQSAALRPQSLGGNDRTMKRLVYLTVLALTAFSPAMALAGGDPEAKSLLETLYKPYTDAAAQESATEPATDEDAKNARFYTPELVELMARDRKESSARNEVGRLDFDPLTNSQDWEAAPVDVAVEDAGQGKARGAATFTLFNKTTVVRFDLVKTTSGWRIGDIHWNDVKEGLKDILKKPLP
jgi:hypothetical protein